MSATIYVLPNWCRVEVDGGVITSSSNPASVGGFHYFVDVVERDGGHVSMWSGEDYDHACDVAAELSKDFGVGVHDKLRGRAN